MPRDTHEAIGHLINEEGLLEPPLEYGIRSQPELFREHRVQPERNIGLRWRSLAFGAIFSRASRAGRAVVLTRLAMLGSRHGASVVRPLGLSYYLSCKTPSL
jgi:hypothetical protein